MYNTLLRMWKKGKITAEQIDKAVADGWITAEQALTSSPSPRTCNFHKIGPYPVMGRGCFIRKNKHNI